MFLGIYWTTLTSQLQRHLDKPRLLRMRHLCLPVPVQEMVTSYSSARQFVDQ